MGLLYFSELHSTTMGMVTEPLILFLKITLFDYLYEYQTKSMRACWTAAEVSDSRIPLPQFSVLLPQAIQASIKSP